MTPPPPPFHSPNPVKGRDPFPHLILLPGLRRNQPHLSQLLVLGLLLSSPKG